MPEETPKQNVVDISKFFGGKTLASSDVQSSFISPPKLASLLDVVSSSVEDTSNTLEKIKSDQRSNTIEKEDRSRSDLKFEQVISSLMSDIGGLKSSYGNILKTLENDRKLPAVAGVPPEQKLPEVDISKFFGGKTLASADVRLNKSQVLKIQPSFIAAPELASLLDVVANSVEDKNNALTKIKSDQRSDAIEREERSRSDLKFEQAISSLMGDTGGLKSSYDNILKTLENDRKLREQELQDEQQKTKILKAEQSEVDKGVSYGASTAVASQSFTGQTSNSQTEDDIPFIKKTSNGKNKGNVLGGLFGAAMAGGALTALTDDPKQDPGASPSSGGPVGTSHGVNLKALADATSKAEGNYTSVGIPTNYGHALGRYQFMTGRPDTQKVLLKNAGNNKSQVQSLIDKSLQGDSSAAKKLIKYFPPEDQDTLFKTHAENTLSQIKSKYPNADESFLVQKFGVYHLTGGDRPNEKDGLKTSGKAHGDKILREYKKLKPSSTASTTTPAGSTSKATALPQQPEISSKPSQVAAVPTAATPTQMKSESQGAPIIVAQSPKQSSNGASNTAYSSTSQDLNIFSSTNESNLYTTHVIRELNIVK